MSGIYDNPLIIAFGLLSCALCTWVVFRLGLVTKTAAPVGVRIWNFTKYVAWLIVEIGKADWAVTKVIVSKQLPKRQRLIKVPSNQKGEFAKTLFANSITITPGTVTVETESDHFIVHALTDESADLAALEAMGHRVCETEQVNA